MVRYINPEDGQAIISFDEQLSQEVKAFMALRGQSSEICVKIVTDVIMSLSHYREEGRRLLPVVYWGNDLNEILQSLNGRDPVTVGRGPLNKETARRALKQCAPLGEGRSWVVYMVASNGELEYGIFRTSDSMIEPTSLERLRLHTNPNLSVMGIVQLAEGVIELRLSNGLYRYVFLPISLADPAPPPQILGSFLKALTQDVPDHLKSPVHNFYYRVVLDVLRVWQGTLAVVLPQSWAVPVFLKDGIWLEEPLDITGCIARYVEDSNETNAAAVRALGNLIRGMMSADGIVAMSSDGHLVAFNVFLQHPTHSNPSVAPLGGARKRTYDILQSHIGPDLVAAFYRSQDGAAECQTIWTRDN